MDEIPDTHAREIGSDLIEIKSRLGEPLSIHQTNRARAYWRLFLGGALILASLIFHLLFWSRIIPWPGFGQVHLWSHLLTIGLAAPLGGFALVTFALKSLRMCILVYPNGLFVWHQGSVLAFLWDEIDRIHFSRLPAEAEYQKPSFTRDSESAGYYELSRTGGKLIGTTITVIRQDGVQVAVTSVLLGFKELGERIQIETFRLKFQDEFQALLSGQTLTASQFSLDASTLSTGTHHLKKWEFDRIDRDKEHLKFFRKGKKRPWEQVPTEEIGNPHVFMAIIDQWANTDLEELIRTTPHNKDVELS